MSLQTQGPQLRGGQVGGLNALQQQGGTDASSQAMVQLAQKMLEAMQNKQAQGGGGAQKAGQTQGDGQEGESLEAMFRKLQEMVAQNPAAFKAAMQNPAMQQVMSTAFSGGGGGGSVGKA